MNIITPSKKFNEVTVSLAIIAGFAKAASQMDLYNQAKEAYDDMLRHYNAQKELYAPKKKKGFWSSFLPEEDVPVFMPVQSLEDNISFQVSYEQGLKMSPYELSEQIKKTIALCHIYLG